MYILFLLLGFIQRLNAADVSYFCLTWDIHNETLELICRVRQFEDPVYINDISDKRLGECISGNNSMECVTTKAYSKMIADFENKLVMLSIDIPSYGQIDGVWTCVQSDSKTTAVVSRNIGIIVDTDTVITGGFVNESTNDIVLTCSSCRVPRWNVAEFLINGKTVDTIAYNNPSRSCSHRNGACNSNTCSCSANIFVLAIQLLPNTSSAYFSCDMRFEDVVTGIQFDQLATVLLEDRAFEAKITATNITKHGSIPVIPTISITDMSLSPVPYSSSTHTVISPMEKDTLSLLIGILILTVFLIVLGVLFACYAFRSSKRFMRSKPKAMSLGFYEEVHTRDEQSGFCKTCNQATSHAICNCQSWFCEHGALCHYCATPDHDIAQKRDEFKIRKRNLRCMGCYPTSPTNVYTQSSHVFCDNCTTNHKYQSIKQMVCHTPIKSYILSEKRKYTGHKQLTHTYRLPSYDSDIIGLACLSNETIVAVDYTKLELLGFRQKSLIFSCQLKAEPRALTKVNSNTIAVSFACKKCIRIFQVESDKIVEKVDQTIDLMNVGKPFNISYSNNCYAVEVGERKNAFIAILNVAGNGNVTVINKIQHNDYSFGYFTGHNLRLALDMNKKLLYISAIGKQKIYCVDFKGNIKWHIKVRSPRQIHIVPSNSNNSNILFTSNAGNAVYQLKGDDESMQREEIDYIELANEEDEIENPECVSYNPESFNLYVGMEKGVINVYWFPDGL